ncbi:MAG: DUF4345 domain-containing protein, partial [Chloroflexota bacterium]
NRYLAGLGVAISDPSQLNIFRSFGGFYLGFAVYLAVALRQKNLLDGALISVVLAMIGFAIGRIVGLIADGFPDSKIWVSLVIELFFSVWGLLVLWRSNAYPFNLSGKEIR